MAKWTKHVVCLCLLMACYTGADNVQLVTFDGHKATEVYWSRLIDPGMAGGKSRVTFTVDKKGKILVFDGRVAVKPLGGVGFISVQGSHGSRIYPDLRSCERLVLNAKAATDYEGLFVSFGADLWSNSSRAFGFGYRAPLKAPVGEFGDVVLPFHGFSKNIDADTGRQITTCSEDPKACPTNRALQNISPIQIVAQGVVGHVHLEVKSIRAEGCELLGVRSKYNLRQRGGRSRKVDEDPRGVDAQ